MLRHPIYLLLCAFAVVYLAVAAPRGWSVWHMARGFGGGGRVGSYGTSHHK